MAKTIPTEAVQDKTSASILSYVIDAYKKSMHINWAKGYMDGEDFVPVEAYADVISGDDYAAIAEAMGDNSKTLKEQFEDAIWAWLVAQGKIVLS